MIRLENVTKVYKGEVVALRDASADIQKGEFVFLVGPSGSGKSTLLRLLNKAGGARARADLRGRQGHRRAARAGRCPYLRRNIGCVFQDFKLLPNKTVYENVAFALEVIGRPKHVISRRCRRSSSWSAWPRRQEPARTSCPAASSSACRSPGRSSTGR